MSENTFPSALLTTIWLHININARHTTVKTLMTHVHILITFFLIFQYRVYGRNGSWNFCVLRARALIKFSNVIVSFPAKVAAISKK